MSGPCRPSKFGKGGNSVDMPDRDSHPLTAILSHPGVGKLGSFVPDDPPWTSCYFQYSIKLHQSHLASIPTLSAAHVAYRRGPSVKQATLNNELRPTPPATATAPLGVTTRRKIGFVRQSQFPSVQLQIVTRKLFATILPCFVSPQPFVSLLSPPAARHPDDLDSLATYRGGIPSEADLPETVAAQRIMGEYTTWKPKVTETRLKKQESHIDFPERPSCVIWATCKEWRAFKSSSPYNPHVS
jgi:hypothetical protein